MTIFVAVVLAAAVALYAYKRRGRGSPEVSRDATPALDAFVAAALERALAPKVLGVDAPTDIERRRLHKTLRDEPDPEVVGKIEETVAAVELEVVRYAHETSADVTVRVRYEGGQTGAASRRLALTDVPEAIREELDGGVTRVYRTWSFPWQRASAL